MYLVNGYTFAPRPMKGKDMNRKLDIQVRLRPLSNGHKGDKAARMAVKSSGKV